MNNKIAKFFFKLGTLFTTKAYTSDRQLQKLKEQACVENGHLWTTYKDPNKPMEQRMYCRRCGQLYHKHEYISKQ